MLKSSTYSRAQMTMVLFPHNVLASEVSCVKCGPRKRYESGCADFPSFLTCDGDAGNLFIQDVFSYFKIFNSSQNF